MKVYIKVLRFEEDLVFKIKTVGATRDEFFITCKQGFELLRLKCPNLLGGDGLGYMRVSGGTRIHNLLQPTKEGCVVDHINRDRRDNRLSNLREVSYHDNSRNKSVHHNNKVGYKYISWSEHANSYRVVIDSKHVAYRKTIEGALLVRDDRLRALNHPYSIKSR